MIGLSGSQFFERMSACANGDSSSANGTGALYVQGCITDDPNSVGVEVGTMAGVYFLQRLSCYIVPLVMMIAKAAGSKTAFAEQTPEAKTEVLREVDRGPDGAAFKAMVATALHDYYTSDTVVAALGWRQGAPQPSGHKLVEADEATWQRLEKVKCRTRLWR